MSYYSSGCGSGVEGVERCPSYGFFFSLVVNKEGMNCRWVKKNFMQCELTTKTVKRPSEYSLFAKLCTKKKQ